MEAFVGKHLSGSVLAGLAAFLLAVPAAESALASEYPIGEPVVAAAMEVAAVFLQPVEMDPPGMMLEASQADIHLEADIQALAGNPHGFAEGAWVPYLQIHYELTKTGSEERRHGHLMPMVASDGPHYGDNVKLMGAGSYHLRLTVAPPSADPQGHFGRHTDKETGVAPWFEPFTADYDFVFAGTGKKGSY
ncbi:MAG: iron transporter [Bacteroidota bacterium]